VADVDFMSATNGGTIQNVEAGRIYQGWQLDTTYEVAKRSNRKPIRIPAQFFYLQQENSGLGILKRLSNRWPMILEK
jgi:hypothetical protein